MREDRDTGMAAGMMSVRIGVRVEAQSEYVAAGLVHGIERGIDSVEESEKKIIAYKEDNQSIFCEFS